MGGTTFSTRAKGTSADDAFEGARQQAQFDHGHSGYTGTIAEKYGFTLIVPNPGETPDQCEARLQDADDPRIRDKWGPAGCIDCGNGEFLFFGWASC